MGYIVYHGTWSNTPPHEVDQPSFHTGTPRAAFRRVQDLHESGKAPKGATGAYLDKYEITERAPAATGTYIDAFDSEPESRGRLVPEGKNIRKIYPYTNQVEDSGNESFLIPTNFVKKGMVRHLGRQFIDTETISSTRPHHFSLEDYIHEHKQ